MTPHGQGPAAAATSADQAPPLVVRARDLRVRRGGNTILRGLDLDLRRGSVTGLLGPSGCGKTTLMRSLVGVQRYDGELCVLGHRPGSPATRGRVGYMAQGTAVYTDLTARQNLAYFASLAGSRSRAVGEVLDTVGLADIADRPVSGLAAACAVRPRKRNLMLLTARLLPAQTEFTEPGCQVRQASRSSNAPARAI